MRNIKPQSRLSPTDKLIERLEGVKQTGPDQWIACCPAHADKSPSLSIKRVDDRALVHCFAGCHIDDVLTAIGLELGDLFDKPKAHRQLPVTEYQRRRTAQALELMNALRHELLIVLLAAFEVTNQRQLSSADLDRLSLAHERILDALTLVIGEDRAQRLTIK